MTAAQTFYSLAYCTYCIMTQSSTYNSNHVVAMNNHKQDIPHNQRRLNICGHPLALKCTPITVKALDPEQCLLELLGQLSVQSSLKNSRQRTTNQSSLHLETQHKRVRFSASDSPTCTAPDMSPVPAGLKCSDRELRLGKSLRYKRRCSVVESMLRDSMPFLDDDDCSVEQVTSGPLENRKRRRFSLTQVTGST